MKQKTKMILAVLALIVVAFGIFLGWRIYEVNRLESIHRVIQEAWDQPQSDDMPEYLKYIDMYSDFSIEKIEKGDPWVITIRVMGVDLAEQMRNIDPALFSADMEEWELDTYLVSLVKKADLIYVDCFVYLYPQDDGFRVQFTETFVDAMSGMTLTYAREMAQEVVGGTK